MKLHIVDDPALVHITDGDPKNGVEGEAYILKDDLDNAKDFTRELMKEPNMTIRQRWERAYYKQVKEQYTAHVAGALLQKVWDWTKDEEVSY